MLLPQVIVVNQSVSLPQYAQLARACDVSGATDRLAVRNFVSMVGRLQRTLLLPQNLQQAGVTKAQWDEQEKKIIQAALADACCKTNPVPVTESLLMDVLRTVRP